MNSISCFKPAKSIHYSELSVSRNHDNKLRFAHLGHVNGTEKISRNKQISKTSQISKLTTIFDKALQINSESGIKTSTIISKNDAQLYKPSRARVREIIDQNIE